MATKEMETLSFGGNDVYEVTDKKAIKYTTQSLTESEKTQARKNIGAVSSDDVPFRFAVDSNGNYGYIKDGADTVTPFKTGGGTEGGDTSIDMSDATITAGMIPEGEIGYGSKGRIEGNVPVYGNGTTLFTNNAKNYSNGVSGGKIISSYGYLDTNKTAYLKQVNDDALIRIATYINADFGNATPADVAKGVKFTSVNGFQLTGESDNNFNMNMIDSFYAWKTWQAEIIETEKTNVYFYEKPLAGVVSNAISYSDEIKIINGELSLINPIYGNYTHDLFETILGKYVYSNNLGGFYKIPLDANKATAGNNSWETKEYGVTKAYKLSIGTNKGDYWGNTFSPNRDEYPDNDQQGVYWYIYRGKVGELLA